MHKFVNLFLPLLLFGSICFGQDGSLDSIYIKCKTKGLLDCDSIINLEISNLGIDTSGFKQLFSFSENILKSEGPQKAQVYFEKSLELAQSLNENELLRSSSERVAATLMYQGKNDLALPYYNDQLKYSKLLNDDFKIASSKLNIGTIHRKQGDFESALNNYLEAADLVRGLEGNKYAGFPYYNIGILYGINGKYEKSIDAFKQSMSYFKESERIDMSASTAVNIGNSYNSLNQLDSAVVYLNYAIPVFEQSKDVRSLINAETQLGRTYFKQELWEKGYQSIENARQRAKEQNLQPQVIYNTRILADFFKGQGDLDQAMDFAQELLSYHEDQKLSMEYVLALKLVSDIYSEKGDFKNAFKYQADYNKLQDSLTQSKNSDVVSNLQLKYDNIKNENEIITLNQKNEREASKKRLAIRTSMFAFLTGILIAFFLIFKNKRDKEILGERHQKEKIQRENIELQNDILKKDLDLKNKELVSNTLLISKKNEFLKSLLPEVEKIDLQNKRLKNVILKEIESEKDWEEFIKVFKNTHSTFMRQLNDAHPDLSTTEIRLCCLVKMNLSNKEISSLLNISYEGIKKAKYRLRKKLQLEAETKLDHYIFSIEE